MGIEKRAQKRVFISIDVDVVHESRLSKLYSRNLSKGGIYLKADEPLPVGEEVELSFYIKEIDKKINVKAVVVHSHSYETFEDETTLKTHHGMGLKFVDISKEDQEVLDKFIIGKEMNKGD